MLVTVCRCVGGQVRGIRWRMSVIRLCWFECCAFIYSFSTLYFFFQAEDGIRFHCVTGVQTCALPISVSIGLFSPHISRRQSASCSCRMQTSNGKTATDYRTHRQNGRESCRERVQISVVAVSIKKKKTKYVENMIGHMQESQNLLRKHTRRRNNVKD